MRPRVPTTPGKPAKGKAATPKKAAARKPEQAPKREEFLRRLEKMNRKERWREVVALGRAAGAEGAASDALALLRELSASGVSYERVVGAVGLWQANCPSEIKRLLRDPCGRVASLAMAPAAVHLSDADVLELFKELPRRRLFQLCSRLARKKRLPALVDDYLAALPPLARSGPAHALLAWASDACLAKQPTVALRLLTQKEWHTVARRCPHFVLEFAEKELKGGVLSDATHARIKMFLYALRCSHPPVGLKLLASAVGRVEVARECLELYFRAFPEPVAALIVKHKLRAELYGPCVMKKLRPETVLALYDANGLDYDSLENLFWDAPPKLRALLYPSRREKLNDTNGALKSGVVLRLPDPVERRREAMRALTEVAELRTDPVQWAEYLPALPFPEAFKMAGQHLRNRDVEIRAAVCGSVAETGRLYPEHLQDVLDFCIGHEKENDVVRGRIIWRLFALPPSLWKEEHYPKLVKIVRAACDSRDISRATSRRIEEFVGKTARFNTLLVDAFLVELCGREVYPCELWQTGLPHSTVVHAWNCLLPFIKEKRDKKEFFPLYNVLRNLGPSLRLIGKSAVDFLKSLLKYPDSSTAQLALSLLFKYFRPVAMELLPGLLKESLDVIGDENVKHAVSVHFQGEWLDRYLVSICTKGHFGSPKKKWLVMFKTGSCWTAAKQEVYARSIGCSLSDKSLGLYCTAEHLCVLRKLYSANVTEVIAPYIKEDYPAAYLRDKAIELLGRLDDAASLKALTDAFGDERIRVAIYAISPRLRDLPTPRIIEVLDVPLHSKLVAVQKVAVRIVADVADEAAYAFLRQLRQDTALHPDVEAAWLCAMFRFLDKPEVWDVLLSAAGSTRDVVAMTLVGVPDDTLVEDWQLVCLDKLFAKLLLHVDPCVVLKVLGRLERRPLRRDAEVVPLLLRLLKALPNQAFLSPIVHALAFSSADVCDVVSVFVGLRPESRLCDVAGALGELSGKEHSRFEVIAVAFFNALLENRCQAAAACRLICKLPVKDLVQHLNEVLQKGLLHAGAVHEVLEELQRGEVDVAAYDAAEEQLRRHANPYMQRIGLVLLRSAASAATWNEERREALEVYRNAADAWVRDDARVIDLPAKRCRADTK
ncbi:uncharacterized protein Tco025E_07598 [Trypanosoma conorhini]|uniref:ARM-like helical domain-containing protein n=1 Tax=Trypanosoma conorhini TaxID=83891 RepID=A0A422NLF1_9TRYP|nr:uncharacterized protein Tco025E_07598 [Trypanosoma conorhini]RNF06322.1 hypothetical protein Tco025E_07598 [Trypanosoma conorhini]